MAEIWHKTCKKQTIFTSFRGFTVIFLFFADFDASKGVLWSLFVFFCENLT